MGIKNKHRRVHFAIFPYIVEIPGRGQEDYWGNYKDDCGRVQEGECGNYEDEGVDEDYWSSEEEIFDNDDKNSKKNSTYGKFIDIILKYIISYIYK